MKFTIVGAFFAPGLARAQSPVHPLDHAARFGDFVGRELREVLLAQHFSGREDDHVVWQVIEILGLTVVLGAGIFDRENRTFADAGCVIRTGLLLVLVCFAGVLSSGGSSSVIRSSSEVSTGLNGFIN